MRIIIQIKMIQEQKVWVHDGNFKLLLAHNFNKIC